MLKSLAFTAAAVSAQTSVKDGWVRSTVELPGVPLVIFTTAHAEHAVRAFEVAAVDYLLKPIARERLAEAIERARGRMGRAAASPAPDAPPRITARSGGHCHQFARALIDRLSLA